MLFYSASSSDIYYYTFKLLSWLHFNGSSLFFYYTFFRFALFLGLKGVKLIFEASSFTCSLFKIEGNLTISAKIFAIAETSYKWRGSLRSSSIGLGAHLRPDQKSIPVSSIVWSAGKLYKRCRILWLKVAWKNETAISTQPLYCDCLMLYKSSICFKFYCKMYKLCVYFLRSYYRKLCLSLMNADKFCEGS
jgi:hypothetical protein